MHWSTFIGIAETRAGEVSERTAGATRRFGRRLPGPYWALGRHISRRGRCAPSKLPKTVLPGSCLRVEGRSMFRNCVPCWRSIVGEVDMDGWIEQEIARCDIPEREFPYLIMDLQFACLSSFLLQFRLRAVTRRGFPEDARRRDRFSFAGRSVYKGGPKAKTRR